MPIISNEPPDPPFDELCNLTKMMSAKDLCAALFNGTKVKVMEVKQSKPLRGVKVSTPGSADNSSFNDLGSPVAKSCSLQTSFDHTGMGDVGNVVCSPTSSKGGIASAKICNVNDRDMAGSGALNEHTSMEDVVNTYGVCSSSQDGIASYKKPIASNGGTWNMDGGKSFGSSMRSNQFSAVVDRFAEKLKQGSEEIALKMEYVPSSVCKLENGNRRISFSTEEVYKGGKACSLQLYGYFVGTLMDYRVVRGNLMRMWRIHDIEDITKANSGVYYFKFKSEEGMKRVLESGPWMIQNVPLVLNVWEPGIWLEKTKPSSIPIWVCVYNIPMELCNGSGIGKIMSGVGKPLLMDKITRERFLKKAGKMDFDRVLVEVSAKDDLLNVLEIKYPPLGNKPACISKLEVRPRRDKEIAAKTLKDVLNVGKSNVIDKGKSMTDDDRFTVVGKKNKPTASHNSNAGNVKSGGNFNNTSKSSVQKEKKKSIVDKPILASVFNHNYRPKVLVRGSGLDNVTNRPLNEDIPINNPFNILSNKGENVKDLGDINVNEEFESKVWPDLKEEVDILLEAGIYPSKQDDKGDIDSDDEGIAVDMKPEVDVNAVDNMEINAAFNNDIFDGKKNLSRICNRVLGRWDWVSNSSSCDSGTRIIVGWDPNNVNIMVLNQSSQVMHCFVEPVNGNPGIFCSFVYACVRTVDRRSLCKSLSIHKNFVKDKPWTILGDFNACLDPAERSTG
nr:hypothetical protein [Tanacetum cinerariifolium]